MLTRLTDCAVWWAPRSFSSQTHLSFLNSSHGAQSLNLPRRSVDDSSEIQTSLLLCFLHPGMSASYKLVPCLAGDNDDRVWNSLGTRRNTYVKSMSIRVSQLLSKLSEGLPPSSLSLRDILDRVPPGECERGIEFHNMMDRFCTTTRAKLEGVWRLGRGAARRRCACHDLARL